MVVLLSACADIALLENNLANVAYQDAQLSYNLDREQTQVRFRVGQTRGKFRVADARLSFPQHNLAAGVLEVTLATASVDVLNPLVENMLRGREWFDSNNHPLALFRTNPNARLTPTPQGSVQVEGLLKIKAINQPLTLTVTFPAGMPDLADPPDHVVFHAEGSFKRSSYDMSALPGFAPDQVQVVVDGTFVRQGYKTAGKTGPNGRE